MGRTVEVSRAFSVVVVLGAPSACRDGGLIEVVGGAGRVGADGLRVAVPLDEHVRWPGWASGVRSRHGGRTGSASGAVGLGRRGREALSQQCEPVAGGWVVRCPVGQVGAETLSRALLTLEPCDENGNGGDGTRFC